MSQATRFLKRPLVIAAGALLLITLVVEVWIIVLKEDRNNAAVHIWGEFTLAILPNVIVGLVAFILVYLFIESRDDRQRYISAMRAVRVAAGKMPGLSEAQIQDFMVPMVRNISQLYFGKDMPEISDPPARNKPECTLCPKSTSPQHRDGRCSKCKEIPECWTVEITSAQ
jgi:hypothetical protein